MLYSIILFFIVTIKEKFQKATVPFETFPLNEYN